MIPTLPSLSIQLRQAAISTFETLAFLFTEGEPDEPVPSMTARTCVAFRGPVHGRLELHMTEDLLPVLAANMLGEDAVAGAGDDALGEIANVICGNLLPSLAGPAAVYDLSAPCRGAAGGEPGEAVARVRLALDGGCADLLLFLDGDATGA